MTKTQKTLLVTAAVAGLVGGVIANAKVNVGNSQSPSAGKPAPSVDIIKMSCNGCGGKTNKASLN